MTTQNSVNSKSQQEFDEIEIDDDDLEMLLEDFMETRQDRLSADKAHAENKKRLDVRADEEGWSPGTVVRCGLYQIKVTVTEDSVVPEHTRGGRRRLKPGLIKQ